ncbi:hypothetical protein [Actinoplanes sp. NPDC023714]|uniref:hypothetical protein n=1 Tax=Actinoplanes sp. NPDC023714 TaxID=3154322 RepID=UPI0033F5337B
MTQASAAPASAAPTSTKRWTVAGLEPIGQPLAAGAAIIGYTRRDQRFYLTARNPANGSPLWEAEAIKDEPVRAGEWIVYREPEEALGPGYASLVVADPLTGRQIQRSPSMIFSGTPRRCFHDRAVCVTAAPEPGEEGHGYRLDLISGAFIPSGAGIPGEGLIRIGTEVVLIRDGAVLWRRPDPGVLRWTEIGGVWVGRTRTGSVGLAATDGRLLWTVPGTLTDCGVPLRAAVIRCRAGRVESYDPLTGKAHWSAPLRGPIGAGAGAIVVRGVAIALTTGARSPAAGPYWCFTSAGLATICGGGVPPVAAWRAVGAESAGYAVVATPAGYFGMSVDATP